MLINQIKLPIVKEFLLFEKLPYVRQQEKFLCRQEWVLDVKHQIIFYIHRQFRKKNLCVFIFLFFKQNLPSPGQSETELRLY